MIGHEPFPAMNMIVALLARQVREKEPWLVPGYEMLQFGLRCSLKATDHPSDNMAGEDSPQRPAILVSARRDMDSGPSEHKQ
jgi:hypothetical protein